MTLHLEVYGRTWGGFKSVYQYSQHNATAQELIDNPGRFAGDFESVIDYRVVEETNEYENVGRGLLRRVDTFKTLRGFRNGMTPRRFNRLANGY